MRDHRITVRLTGELRNRVKQAAKRKGVRESDFMRDAVEEHLAATEERPTAYELAKKAGLIGIVRGAARDLSTNRGHFEGFGRS